MLTANDARTQLLAAQAYERAQLERHHAIERGELRVLVAIERSHPKRSLCENAHKRSDPWSDVRVRS